MYEDIANMKMDRSMLDRFLPKSEIEYIDNNLMRVNSLSSIGLFKEVDWATGGKKEEVSHYISEIKEVGTAIIIANPGFVALAYFPFIGNDGRIIGYHEITFRDKESIKIWKEALIGFIDHLKIVHSERVLGWESLDRVFPDGVPSWAKKIIIGPKYIILPCGTVINISDIMQISKIKKEYTPALSIDILFYGEREKVGVYTDEEATETEMKKYLLYIRSKLFEALNRE